MKPTGVTALYSQKIDVLQVIENSKNKKFAVNLIFWTFLLMIVEAIDIAGISYAAPVLMKLWDVSPKTFGTVFAAAPFGLMLGGFIFGYLGDRIGRKKTLLISTFWFGVLTLFTIFSTSVTTLIVLRFLAALGLGGTVPLAIVLVNEYAPKRSRAKWVGFMFTGFPLGMSLGGFLAGWLIPNFGWKSIFIAGGIFPLLLIVALMLRLPESIKFLVLKNKNKEEITRVLLGLDPKLKIGPDTQFIMENEEKNVEFSPKMLFAGVLLFITPILWIYSIFSSFSIYFLNNWLPQVFVSSGLSLKDASFATSLYHLAGMLVGSAVGWLFDKRGMLACLIFPIVGSILVAVLGLPLTKTVLMFVVFAAGFFVVGVQMVLTVSTPMFYPTAYRSNANGIAMGIAKIGSIAGPIIGGILLSMKLPLNQLFMFISLAIIISGLLLTALGLFYRRHYIDVKDPVISDSETVGITN